MPTHFYYILKLYDTETEQWLVPRSSDSNHYSYLGLAVQSPNEPLPRVNIDERYRIIFKRTNDESISLLFQPTSAYNPRSDRIWIVEFLLKKCLGLRKLVHKDILHLRREEIEFCPIFRHKLTCKIMMPSEVRSEIAQTAFAVELSDIFASCVDIRQGGLIVGYKGKSFRADSFHLVRDELGKLDISKSTVVHNTAVSPPDFLFFKFCKLSGVHCNLANDVALFILCIDPLRRFLDLQDISTIIGGMENPEIMLAAFNQMDKDFLSFDVRKDVTNVVQLLGVPSHVHHLYFEKVVAENNCSTGSLPTVFVTSDRLSALGVTVLKLFVSNYVFRTNTDAEEGTLTALASELLKTDQRVEWAVKLGLSKLIICKSFLAGKAVLISALEAFLGSIYLDRGSEPCVALLDYLLGAAGKTFSLSIAENVSIIVPENIFPRDQLKSLLSFISGLESRLGIRIRNRSLFVKVFVHKSYSDHIEFKSFHNERLEFLGDAALEMACCILLFQKKSVETTSIPILRSLMVRNETLAVISKSLGLTDHIFVKEKQASSKYFADVFEALLGAIMIDQGFDFVLHVVNTQLMPLFDSIRQNQAQLNPKNHLQELVHVDRKRKGLVPLYPDYVSRKRRKQTICSVSVDGKEIGHGIASSKVQAERNAAMNAISSFHP